MILRILLAITGLLGMLCLTSTTHAQSRPNHPPAVSTAVAPSNPAQFGNPLPGLSATQAIRWPSPVTSL